METHARSIAKSCSWQIIGTLVTTCIAYVVTGKVSYAVISGSSEAICKIIMYWAHERIWQRVRWGRAGPLASSPLLPIRVSRTAVAELGERAR